MFTCELCVRAAFSYSSRRRVVGFILLVASKRATHFHRFRIEPDFTWSVLFFGVFCVSTVELGRRQTNQTTKLYSVQISMEHFLFSFFFWFKNLCACVLFPCVSKDFQRKDSICFKAKKKNTQLFLTHTHTPFEPPRFYIFRVRWYFASFMTPNSSLNCCALSFICFNFRFECAYKIRIWIFQVVCVCVYV